MRDHTLSIGGIQVPRFFYGTAWKEDETQRLCELALQCGFRGVDTANQRRHYHEAAVGKAITVAIASGFVTRNDLFLQTKFTFRHGQDHRLPYDERAPIAAQIEQSFASSLEHLGTERLDSYLLHGPVRRAGLTADDVAAWRAIEAIHDRGQARLIGVSNVTLEQLDLLCREARVRPHFVQNRCFATAGWDQRVRQFCAAHGIVYQGFSLLTANREALSHPELAEAARKYQLTVSQIVFRFAIDVGMIPLTGTTNSQHMHEDLAVLNGRLAPADIRRIEHLLTQ